MPPQIVEQITKTTNKRTIRQKLTSLAKSNKTWYGAITLMMAGAGYAVAKRYGKDAHIQISRQMVDMFERLGHTLGYKRGPFDARRLQTLDDQKTSILKRVQQGTLSAHKGLEMLTKKLRDSDPPKIRGALKKDFAVKADAYAGKTRHPSYWFYEMGRNAAYKPYGVKAR